MVDKPKSIKAILVISWIQIIFLIYMISGFIAFSFFSLEGGFIEGFRKGFLEAAGYDPEMFYATEAGAATANYVTEFIGPIFMLAFLKFKWCGGIRALSVIYLVILFMSDTFYIFPIILVALAFQKSVSEYCRKSKEVVVKENRSDVELKAPKDTNI